MVKNMKKNSENERDSKKDSKKESDESDTSDKSNKPNKSAKSDRPDAQAIDELTNDLQRLQAEFENFKKRTEKDSKNIWRNSKADFAKKLLPIIDTFEAAIKTSQNKNENGLALIFEQFMKTLYSEGLSEINTEGKFNPEFHEALLQQQSEELDDDEITDVLQKGYMFCDCVIRPAKVKINVRTARANLADSDADSDIHDEIKPDEERLDDESYQLDDESYQLDDESCQKSGKEKSGSKERLGSKEIAEKGKK